LGRWEEEEERKVIEMELGKERETQEKPFLSLAIIQCGSATWPWSQDPLLLQQTLSELCELGPQCTWSPWVAVLLWNWVSTERDSDLEKRLRQPGDGGGFPKELSLEG
jgi:hypothetical protein